MDMPVKKELRVVQCTTIHFLRSALLESVILCLEKIQSIMLVVIPGPETCLWLLATSSRMGCWRWKPDDLGAPDGYCFHHLHFCLLKRKLKQFLSILLRLRLTHLFNKTDRCYFKQLQFRLRMMDSPSICFTKPLRTKIMLLETRISVHT